VKTLFRLTWPWLYILLAIAGYYGGVRLRSRKILAFAAWLAIPMLLYMFIHYQHHLPSRQLYMASMVLVSMFALLVERIQTKRLQGAFIIGFILFNIQYLWLKKDPQFVEIATSTAELIQELRKHTPSKVLIIDFPYPQIEIAKAAVIAVPGWNPEMVSAAAADDTCSACLVLRWDEKKLLHVGERH